MHAGRQLGPRRARATIGARLGPLDGEHRVVVDRVPNLDVEVGGVGREPLVVGLVVGGVRHRQIAVIGEAVGEQVVEDAAVLTAEDRVLGAAHLQPRDVVREQALEQRFGLRAGGLDLSHVRDVEDAARLADREVLGTDALVRHRHLPAREGDQSRPGARRGRRIEGSASATAVATPPG